MQEQKYKQLLDFTAATISDALDMLGVNGGLLGIRPLDHSYKIVGPAYTLAFVDVEFGESAIAADYIDDIAEEFVVVIDNRGRTDCTVWGDILSSVAKKKNLAGTMIYGACRDVDGLLSIGYPIFSMGKYMKSGKNRVKMASKNEKLTIGVTEVFPKDIVFGDASGAVCIPEKFLDRVIEICVEITAMEKNVLKSIEDGATLKAAREKHNYNKFSLKV